jgi:uncharacterized protein
MIGLIRLYQKTHILRAPSCRFYPSCSQYVVESIQRFGLTQGFFLGFGRICRCHPLNDGGVDEVPMSYPWSVWRLMSRLKHNHGVKWAGRKHGAIESPRGSR